MLESLRVVELGLWVAGPAATGVMADLGADVIKVESPAGDPMRQLFRAFGVEVDVVPPFDLDNRGKRSVVLDLAEANQLETMHELLATADVFVTNLRPAALERLGLDPGTVTARHERLVYAAITGYGRVGADRDRAGYDVGAFWARSGAADTMTPPGVAPSNFRPGFGDHVTAITAVAGVLAAVQERSVTGKGRVIDVSLLGTGIWVMGWDMSIQLWFDRISSTRPRERHDAPMVNSYRAGDDRWFWLLGLEQDRHWLPTLTALDRLDLAEHPDYATASLRMANSETLIALLDSEFDAQPRAHWIDRFDEVGVWWAPVSTLADAAADPQAAAAGAFTTIPHDGPPYRSVAAPIGFSGAPPTRAVPALGQHTEEILAELAAQRNDPSAESSG